MKGCEGGVRAWIGGRVRRWKLTLEDRHGRQILRNAVNDIMANNDGRGLHLQPSRPFRRDTLSTGEEGRRARIFTTCQEILVKPHHSASHDIPKARGRECSKDGSRRFHIRLIVELLMQRLSDRSTQSEPKGARSHPLHGEVRDGRAAIGRRRRNQRRDNVLYIVFSFSM